MTRIDAKTKAGPVGRARVSPVLLRRPGLIEPSLMRNANLLATNKRTARGLDPLELDYTAVPSGTQAELEKVVAHLNALIANLKQRGLMELTP